MTRYRIEKIPFDEYYDSFLQEQEKKGVLGKTLFLEGYKHKYGGKNCYIWLLFENDDTEPYYLIPITDENSIFLEIFNVSCASEYLSYFADFFSENKEHPHLIRFFEKIEIGRHLKEHCVELNGVFYAHNVIEKEYWTVLDFYGYSDGYLDIGKHYVGFVGACKQRVSGNFTIKCGCLAVVCDDVDALVNLHTLRCVETHYIVITISKSCFACLGDEVYQLLKKINLNAKKTITCIK